MALNNLEGRSRALAVLGGGGRQPNPILVAAGSAPYARREGTGRHLVEATTPRDALGATFLVLVLGPAIARVPGLAGSGAVLGVAWILTRLARRRLGGITGDILGALVELGELAFLMSLAIVGRD